MKPGEVRILLRELLASTDESGISRFASCGESEEAPTCEWN